MGFSTPLRATGSIAHRLVATTFEVYSGFSFNLLDYLSQCTDAALFGWIALTRVSLLLLMWFSRTVAPVLFRAPGDSFIFDTGEELYDDPRFAMVRQWDGVHMFFIARYGYLYENQVVFFPGLPALIRGVQYVTHKAVPLLHQLAPVALYVCMLNVLASCITGVFLRRLTALTFLGPEAAQSACCRWCWRRKKMLDAADVKRITEATICYRLRHGLTGTSLDAADPLAPLPTTHKDVRATLHRRRRIVGGATLVWVFTPSMVFTVAVYTESLFALTTILGIYYLAWYEPLPWVVQERIASQLAAAPALDELLGDLTGCSQRGPTVAWQQAFTTRAEMVAVLLFTLAATLRSNAFTCAGFLAFPIVVQVVLPKLYAAQCKTTLAGQRAAALLTSATTPASSRVRPPDARERERVVCLTLSCPQRRLPHPLRVCVVLAECAVLLSPYLTINYIGYNRFVTHMWTPAAQAQIGTAFWRLYPMLQKKYWNVSFLSAYTFTNLPNVILALPVAMLVAMCTHTCYLAPAWRARVSAPSFEPQDTSSISCSTLSSLWSRLCAALVPLIRSSNVVHLLALLTLALSSMHVQVTNRFVMSSPALYFLLGAQLAMRPTSFLSQLILMWSILWSIIGGILFANHLPWT